MRRKTEAAARVPGNVLYGRRTILDRFSVADDAPGMSLPHLGIVRFSGQVAEGTGDDRSVSAPGFRIIQLCPLASPGCAQGTRITESFLWRHPK